VQLGLSSPGAGGGAGSKALCSLETFVAMFLIRAKVSSSMARFKARKEAVSARKQFKMTLKNSKKLENRKQIEIEPLSRRHDVNK
jgi:hypothetical protein